MHLLGLFQSTIKEDRRDQALHAVAEDMGETAFREDGLQVPQHKILQVETAGQLGEPPVGDQKLSLLGQGPHGEASVVQKQMLAERTQVKTGSRLPDSSAELSVHSTASPANVLEDRVAEKLQLLVVLVSLRLVDVLEVRLDGMDELLQALQDLARCGGGTRCLKVLRRPQTAVGEGHADVVLCHHEGGDGAARVGESAHEGGRLTEMVAQPPLERPEGVVEETVVGEDGQEQDVL